MILLLVCLVLALTGCSALFGDLPGSSAGAGAGGADGAPGDDPIAGGGGGAVDPAQPPLDGAVREEPDPTVADFRGHAVERFTIGPDGRTVVVYWWGGNLDCYGLREVSVEVQRNTPILTVLEGTRAAAIGKACTSEAVLKSAVVTLDEPILADAADADPAPGEPQLPADAILVEPVAGVVDPIPHAISGYGLSADGLTLSVYYVGGVEECNGLAVARADRDANGLVTVAIREGRLAEAQGPCPEIGVAKVVELRLDEPLLVVGAFDTEAAPETY